MTIEGAVAITAAMLAGSVALLGFGLDSAIEGVASVIVIWRFTGSRRLSEEAEQRAQKLVAISFFLLAPYIAQDAIRTLIGGDRPSTSWVGIGLSISSIVVMPLLGRAKQRIGARLGSAATAGEGTQNMLCAYMAAGVLAGLLANTLLGAWWLDPAIALAIAAIAIHEGIETWRGDGCAAWPSPASTSPRVSARTTAAPDSREPHRAHIPSPLLSAMAAQAVSGRRGAGRRTRACPAPRTASDRTYVAVTSSSAGLIMRTESHDNRASTNHHAIVSA